VSGKANFRTLEAYAHSLGEIRTRSGRLEHIRARLNEYLFEG